MNTYLVLFDDVCNFCNFWVNFIIDHDESRHFMFTSLQSNFAQRILVEKKIDPLEMDSIILLKNEKVYFKSSAALQIAKKLDGLWKMFYILSIIPLPFRDIIYDFIARNRYKWFGRSESCRIPTEEEKERFLPN